MLPQLQIPMAEFTVVFADLTGSTRVFETQGNAKGAHAVQKATQWIGEQCAAHGGHVVKYLGDGVLMVFPDNARAVESVIAMQRGHTENVNSLPQTLRMLLKVGLARGDVVEHDGDCFGDAVNVASRLSDMASAEQIMATESVISALSPGTQVRSRSLGPIEIRGRDEPCAVHRIEWQHDLPSAFLTMAAGLSPSPRKADDSILGIELSLLDVSVRFRIADMPIYLGRDSDAHFIVKSQSVSRLHAKIDWRGGAFHLEDMSSNGTWVRFANADVVLALRRQECVLHGPGEVALGAAFSDISAPTVGMRPISSKSH